MSYTFRDRLQDILDLAFGPFPTLDEAELLTTLEKEIFTWRVEHEELRKRLQVVEKQRDYWSAKAFSLALNKPTMDPPWLFTKEGGSE